MTIWEGDIIAVRRGRVPHYVAALLVVATLLLAVTGHHQLAVSPVFVPVWMLLALAFDMMTIALLVEQYRSGGNPRVLALTWAYVWSGVLTIGVLTTLRDTAVPGSLIGVPDDAVWLMAARLVGGPALVVVSLVPWPRRFERWIGSPDGRAMRSLCTHAAVAAVAVVLAVVVVRDLVPHPPISYVVSGVHVLREGVSQVLVVVNLVLLGVGLVGVRTRRRVSGLEAWALVTLAATAGGTVLTLVSAGPYDVAWYGARVLVVSATVMVLVGMLRDVSFLQSRVRGYARRLEAQNHQLTDAQATRDHLVAVVTHDMRNPLAGLAGYLEVLEDESLQESEVHRIHARARLLTRRLTLMTEDLLASSTTADLTVLPRPLDLRTQLDECVAGFPDLDVVVRCPVGLVVSADPLRLQQVLANLVRNGQKYGAQPVHIDVTRGPGPFARTAVTDAGRGVPAEFLPRLFERYTRADPTRGRGSGLGLAVSRRLAERHGGTLDYEPETKEFVLMMPAVQAQRAKSGFSLARNALTPSVKSPPV